MDDRGWAFWTVIFKANDRLIGYCGFSQIHTGEEEIGWGLVPEYWGPGLATEAAIAVLRYGFERIGLDHIRANVHPDNSRSIRIIERLDMEYVGTVQWRGLELLHYTKTNGYVVKFEGQTTADLYRERDLTVMLAG